MFKSIAVTVMLSVSCCAYGYPVPSTDHHLSASSSTITVAGVVAIEQSPAELQRNASTDRAKSITDDTTLRYTRWAMFGTCASAAIALIQAGLFVWQLALMRRSTEDASEAAKAARDSASIASDMFTKLERPWIFLVAHRVERREGPPIQPQLANNYWVSLVFRNDGRSPAFVKGIEFNFAPKDQLAEVPDYSLCSKLETPATLPVGDSFETRKVGPSRDTEAELTMFGRLTYKDMAGTEHHTGFAINISPHIPAAASNENERYDVHD